MIVSDFQRLAARISAFSAISYAIAYSSQLIDIFWVSRLGPGAPTAIAIVSALFLIILTLNEVIGVSSVALLSQSQGIGDKQRSSELIVQALCLKFVFGVAMATAFLLAISHWANWYTTDAEIQALVLKYSNFIWLSLIFTPVMATALTVLRIIGDEKKTAFISFAALAINAALTPLFIFGGFGFDGLGISGAAIATVLTELSITAVAIGLVVYNRAGLKLSIARLRWEPALYRDFILIGLPIAGVMLLTNLERALITSVVARHPVEVSDGFAIGIRIFTFFVMGTFGIALGTAVAAGQEIGRGRNDTVQNETPAFALSVALAVLMLYAPVLLFAESVIALFTDNETTIAAGATYLQFMCLAVVLYGVYFVYNGPFEGAGRNKPVLAVAVVAYLCIEFPLLFVIEYFLDSNLMLVWSTVLLAIACNVAGIWVLFGRGRWRPAENATV